MHRLALPLAVAAATALLVACGGESARDQALAGLDRATEASGLETEMAGLVSDLSAETLASAEATQQAELEEALDDLDSRAEDLIASADTGQEFDDEIASSAEQTQSAGDDVALAVANPASADKAKSDAVQKLQVSNQGLTNATELIGTELQDEDGNLSAEDAEALEATVADVEASGEAVQAATDVRDLIFDFGGVGSLRIGMTQEEAQAATGLGVEFNQFNPGSPCSTLTFGGFTALGGLAVNGQNLGMLSTSSSQGGAGARTVEGVGIGSTLAEVLAAYPGEVTRQPAALNPTYTELIVEDSDGNSLIFLGDESGGIVTLRVGRPPDILELEGCL